MKEKMNARIGILPLLQAEHDRKYASYSDNIIISNIIVRNGQVSTVFHH